MSNTTEPPVASIRSPFLDAEIRRAPEPEAEAPRMVPQIALVGVNDVPIADGAYAIYQDAVVERGKLGPKGLVPLGKIDPARPFVFEVPDRVCAIRQGAFINPDDPRIEYGGTWFDWTLVRDNVNAEMRFWPHYRKEMDQELRTGVDTFMQHEHITRRPIQIERSVLLQHGTVTIRATPARVRVGPFVRYTDDQRAVIWLETVTPAMVRVKYRRAGARTDALAYASTVRVGGRHFAAVEVNGLAQETFYEYTIELAPLPAAGPIPIDPKQFDSLFPALTSSVATSMVQQFTVPSISKTPWMMFRTLRGRYDKQLRFATGSCRWYPGDKDSKGQPWGPDMMEGLGEWVRNAPKEKWPQFLFMSGDQIYADEIGQGHRLTLVSARFAARIPGPADARPLRDKLVDGAWAGRFAHRFQTYKEPDPKSAGQIAEAIAQLDALYKQYPDIKDIYKVYPNKTRRQALKDRYETLRNRRQIGGAKAEAGDESQARKTLAALTAVENLEARVEPFRALRLHWKAGERTVRWWNSMATSFLVHNFLLWAIPDFEAHLPIVADHQRLTALLRSDRSPYPPAEGGVHAADFAEYAYLYQRAWTSSQTIRQLLAHIPTFLMLDDHEATDDWNFSVEWVRMLHNRQDDFRMWPKTLTDSLAAYWVYQGWCNKPPSQWNPNDERVAALTKARESGTDALPQLRRCIHAACFTPVPSFTNGNASYQSGMRLDWHYKLPFDPPFIVPDCRTRKLLVPADDKLRVIDHDDRSKMPTSQTIDEEQLKWMRGILLDRRHAGSVAFIGASTPLLLQKKFMAFMLKPEVAAGAWARGGDIAGGVAALVDSTMAGVATDAMLRVFRRGKDLEHMIRDKSWRDIWSLVEEMQRQGSPVKSLVVVSGDVHHSYCMTGNLSGKGRPKPEVVQITCSGFQTTIRKDFKSSLAEELSSITFDVGKRRLVPGFVQKDGTGTPDLVLYENAAAIVDVTMGAEVDVAVTYFTGSVALAKQTKHVFQYSSRASYLQDGEPAVIAPYRIKLRSPVTSREASEQIA